MAKYRSRLPQLGDDFFMTDGRIGTTLIFHEGAELPDFVAFHLLDAGNPVELGQQYAALKRQQLKQLNVMGSCCGTDHRHVEAIATACLPLFR